MKLADKMSWIFLGVLYIVAGIVIFRWPETLYYAVAAIFMIQGVVSFLRAFSE